MKVRGIRGATTADANTQDAIVDATAELLTEIVARNDFEIDDIAAANFTATTDLNAEFPAMAARVRLGWTDVALMCAQEMQVPNGQSRSIRVMILVNTDKQAKELHNVYLKGAVNMRRRNTDNDGRTTN
jgi:chorismate mutase